MIFICNNSSLWEAYLCNLPKVRIHVTNKVFDIVSWFKLWEILHQIIFITVWKNIQNLSSRGICDDAVVLLTTGIALEFVQRNHLRKNCRFVIAALEIPHSRHAGNIESAANFLGRYNLLKGKDNLCHKAACNSVVTRQEGISFEKSLATGTAITTLA